MEKSKANFRAIRETLGLSQLDVCFGLGIKNIKTVKNWEREDLPTWKPSPYAWDYILGMQEDFYKQAEDLVSALTKVVDAQGLDKPITLAYYRNREQYIKLGFENGKPFGFINAVARQVAIRMQSKGVAVEFKYPDEDISAKTD